MKQRTFAGCDGGRNQPKLPDSEGCHRGTHRRALVWLLASALAVLGTAEALSAGRHKSGSPDRKKTAEVEHHKSDSSHHKKDKKDKKAAAVEHHRHVIVQPATEDGAPAPLSPDLAATKQAIELVRQGTGKDAIALAASIGDPVAAKLVDWARLRHSDSAAGFDRYLAFIRANPDWPSMSLLRRRAEARLWQERRDGATVRRFVGDKPTSALGRLALARVEMAEGDRAGAESEVRAVWQSSSLTAETETAVLAAFPDVLTRADHVARMDRRIGAKDFGAATRAAKHVGEDYAAIVKACSAAEAKSTNGGKLLDALHADTRGDLAYALCRVHWLLRNDSPGSNMHGRIVTPKENIAAAVYRRMVARTSRAGAEASRHRRCRNRLPGGEHRGASGQSLLPCRRPFHVRLDRAAFSRRSGHGARAFRPHRRRHDRSARAGAWLLLARPRRRGGRPTRRDAGSIRGRGPLSHRLLRPAGTRAAGPRGGRGVAFAAGAGGRRNQ